MTDARRSDEELKASSSFRRGASTIGVNSAGLIRSAIITTN